MEREAGWGDDIPELLRVNQAECLACHKPLSNVSYTFTLQQLSAAK
jgi:hypothetical protein